MNILTVRRIGIKLGEIPLNVYHVTYDDGTEIDLLAGRNVTDAVDMRQGSLTEKMKVKSLKELCAGLIKSDTGESFMPIPLQVAIDYWFICADKGNIKAQSLLFFIKNNRVKPFEQFYNMPLPKYVETQTVKQVASERKIQLRLKSELGGHTEVPCAAGFIDILTPTEIIEVKKIKDWKCAVGQVLVYGKYYPSHQKRIHLFGKFHTSFLSLIKEHCASFDIVVTTEL